MLPAAGETSVTAAFLRGAAAAGRVQTAGENGRLVPRGPLRVPRKVTRVLPPRVRVGVAGGVTKEGVPNGLAEDAVVEPRVGAPQVPIRAPVEVPVGAAVASRAAVTLRHADPALGEGAPAGCPARFLRPIRTAHPLVNAHCPGNGPTKGASAAHVTPRSLVRY